jgi:hypothetical protein
MSGKDAAIGIAIVLALVGAAVYTDHQKHSPDSLLGPAPYIAGPNAESEECKKLTQEWGPMLERQSNEDTQAENRDTAEFDRIMHSQMTESQREVAMNNLSAKEDIAKTAREARQKNDEIRLREKEREAGCQIPNPKF